MPFASPADARSPARRHALPSGRAEQSGHPWLTGGVGRRGWHRGLLIGRPSRLRSRSRDSAGSRTSQPRGGSEADPRASQPGRERVPDTRGQNLCTRRRTEPPNTEQPSHALVAGVAVVRLERWPRARSCDDEANRVALRPVGAFAAADRGVYGTPQRLLGVGVSRASRRLFCPWRLARFLAALLSVGCRPSERALTARDCSAGCASRARGKVTEATGRAPCPLAASALQSVDDLPYPLA